MNSPFSRTQVIACWGVHLYTALGLPLNLISLWALSQKDAHLFFTLNLAAVAVDATDGMMARKLRIKEVLPQFDGSKLDDLIDYLTFTFLPVASLAYLELIPLMWWPLLGVILIASAYGFCQTSAKTEDAFVGFPSYWNLVALYIFLLDPPMWLTLSTLSICAFLTFIPIHFVYPTRTQMLFKTTMIGGAVYGCTLIYCALAPEGELRYQLSLASLIYVLYYFVISAFHHRRVHQTARSAS